MNFDSKDIGIGLVAGLATALLCLGVAAGSGLSILLYLLSSVPIMVAGLGWSLAASGIATVAAIAAVLFVANAQTAIFILVTTALPAAATANWLTLARPAEEVGGPKDKMVWFPLADVLARLCMMVSLGFIVIGALINYGPEMMKPIVDQLIDQLRISNPELNFSDEGKAGLLGSLTELMPFAQPLMWTMVLTGNLYIALRITTASGRLQRPQEDFPSSMRMPKWALIGIGAGVVISLASGSLSYLGAAIAGGFAAGFTLAGFAIFHHMSRGKQWRPIAMLVVYGGAILTLVPVFAMFFLGIFAVARRMPMTNTPNNKSNH